MPYRDLSAALARVEQLEAELRVARTRPRTDWLAAYVFTVVVAGLAMSLLVSVWIYNAS